jgi:hypothetical protein
MKLTKTETRLLKVIQRSDKTILAYVTRTIPEEKAINSLIEKGLAETYTEGRLFFEITFIKAKAAVK